MPYSYAVIQCPTPIQSSIQSSLQCPTPISFKHQDHQLQTSRPSASNSFTSLLKSRPSAFKHGVGSIKHFGCCFLEKVVAGRLLPPFHAFFPCLHLPRGSLPFPWCTRRHDQHGARAAPRGSRRRQPRGFAASVGQGKGRWRQPPGRNVVSAQELLR